jgi:hypothetical protein
MRGVVRLLGGMVLMSEAIATLGRDPERERSRPLVFHLRRGLLVGGFLVALSTGRVRLRRSAVPPRSASDPDHARRGSGPRERADLLGRGGALLAVLGFVLIRGLIAIMVGGVWGQTTPHFPLYLMEALLVEAVFLRARGRSPVATGAFAGVLIGTLGLAAEWAWTNVLAPIPWTSALLPEAAVAGPVTAVAAGAVGGFIGGALTGAESVPARLTAIDKRAALLGAVVLVGVVAWNVPLSEAGPRSATVALRDLEPGPERTVAATIRIDPAGTVADDPEFLNLTAWQGGGSLRDPLDRTGPGE